MKGFIRIGGASLLGIVLVLGAFVMSSSDKAGEGRGVIVSNTHKEYLIGQDENKNGVPDWEEDLNTVALETGREPSDINASGAGGEYEPPSTLTGKFSVAFMKDFLGGKISGSDFNESEQWVGSAIGAIEQATKSNTYSRLQLNIVDTSGSSLFEYGNSVASIVLAHPVKDVDVVGILDYVLKTEDETLLRELAPIEETYEEILSDTLAMSVPTELALEHVALLNNYENLRVDYDAMQHVISDPLYALARIRNYEDHLENLVESIRAITKVLTDNNIVYSNTDTGAYLYIFDI